MSDQKLASAYNDAMEWIVELEDENERLRALVKELADDLECEIEGRYREIKDHPAMAPRYGRDMDVVRRARTALERNGKP